MKSCAGMQNVELAADAAFAGMYVLSLGISLPACVWARHSAAVLWMKRQRHVNKSIPLRSLSPSRAREVAAAGSATALKSTAETRRYQRDR